jgi:hypothetical protein
VAALLLSRYAGMNQRDIGGFLNMGSGSAVCQQFKVLRERQSRVAAVTVRIRAAESSLRNLPSPHEYGQT